MPDHATYAFAAVTHMLTSLVGLPPHFSSLALLKYLRSRTPRRRLHRKHVTFASPQPRDLDEGDFAEME
jgi:hypothetical protein